jgi:glycine/D-amino acid oxidase-like deaminating enzyme
MGQADVVVGFGAAGAATAVTAYDAGAKVILLEKAPLGHEGGNTRVAGQGYLNTSAVEKATAYLQALCGPYRVPDSMVRVWAAEIGQNHAWVASIGGDPQEHQHQPAGIEFPELPGSDCVHKFHHGPIVGYSNTWDMLARAVRARAIEVLYEPPGRELIQPGVTKEILGVRAERDGKACCIRPAERWC